MALRSLMKGKALRTAQKSLEEARAKMEELKTREAELETAIEEAETDEEKAVVEEEVEKFETEKAETEKAVTDLEAEVDKQFRVVLPATLREYANLEKDIVTIGVASRLEIWNKDAWTAYSEAAQDDYEAVAEKCTGLRI